MDLNVKDLCCQRGEAVVLASVSLTVTAGETLVLQGPNGSGKSTLLRTLAGLAPPASGTTDASPEDMVYTGHSDGLKAQLTVAENLIFWARIFQGASAQTAIERFALTSMQHRLVAHLSAGQKKRVALARLVLSRRPIWLLDEPTVSLDQANVKRFAEVVSQHLDQGGSAVIATHIDLGLPNAKTLDVSIFKPKSDLSKANPFAEAVE